MGGVKYDVKLRGTGGVDGRCQVSRVYVRCAEVGWILCLLERIFFFYEFDLNFYVYDSSTC